MIERDGLYCEKHGVWCPDGVCQDCNASTKPQAGPIGTRPAIRCSNCTDADVVVGARRFGISSTNSLAMAGMVVHDHDYADSQETVGHRFTPIDLQALADERFARMLALLGVPLVAEPSPPSLVRPCDHASGYCKDTAHKYELPIE